MKKENKKLAQQRRAEERAKKEQQAKMKKAGIAVAIIAVVALLVFVTVKEVKAPDNDTAATTAGQEAGDAAASAGSSTDEGAGAEPVLNTEEGLEVKDGDTVNIDYTGYKDGVAFDGGSTNGGGADLVIGSGMYIDGFEDGLVGHKVGETVDLNLTFPENYGAKELAGADVVFNVTINGIYE